MIWRPFCSCLACLLLGEFMFEDFILSRESKRKREKARGSKRKQEEARGRKETERERPIRKAGGIRHVQCGKGFVILSLSLLWHDEFT